MLIIIIKRSGTNQWDYPSDIKEYVNGFKNPSDNAELVVQYKGKKTIGQLQDNVSYVIKPYTGKVELERGPERRANSERRK